MTAWAKRGGGGGDGDRGPSAPARPANCGRGGSRSAGPSPVRWNGAGRGGQALSGTGSPGGSPRRLQPDGRSRRLAPTTIRNRVGPAPPDRPVSARHRWNLMCVRACELPPERIAPRWSARPRLLQNHWPAGPNRGPRHCASFCCRRLWRAPRLLLFQKLPRDGCCFARRRRGALPAPAGFRLFVFAPCAAVVRTPHLAWPAPPWMRALEWTPSGRRLTRSTETG